MKNLLEKIREKYESLKIEILFMALFVLLFALLNGRKLSQEASVHYESGGSAAEAETEAWTEGQSEGQSEKLTPEELALAGEGAGSGAGGMDGSADAGETGNGSSDGMEENVLLEEIRLQDPALAEFRAPMAMPEQETEPVGYRTGLACYRWQPAAGGSDDRPVEIKITAYRPFRLLKRMIENRIAEYDGDWSVYVKNLKTDEELVVNDRPMKSASVMKLFILGTVYKAIEAGEMERTDEVVSLMNNMITASDNDASNQLLYLLGDSDYEDGIAKVDAFIQEYGFSEMTVEYNGFNSEELLLDASHSNQVSARDCGKLLEDIYRRRWVNRAAANEIEQMMLNQQTRYKIPAGLPDGVSCGNKTGEMETTENDAAIIYAQNCDYILVVLSSDWGNKNQAIERIASMSGMVYEFLN